jgi:hypothetical protein
MSLSMASFSSLMRLHEGWMAIWMLNSVNAPPPPQHHHHPVFSVKEYQMVFNCYRTTTYIYIYIYIYMYLYFKLYTGHCFHMTQWSKLWQARERKLLLWANFTNAKINVVMRIRFDEYLNDNGLNVVANFARNDWSGGCNCRSVTDDLIYWQTQHMKYLKNVKSYGRNFLHIFPDCGSVKIPKDIRCVEIISMTSRA